MVVGSDMTGACAQHKAISEANMTQNLSQFPKLEWSTRVKQGDDYDDTYSTGHDIARIGGKLVAEQFGTFSTASVKPGLPPWRPHVRFRRVQTLVREGSPLVKLRNSA